MVQWVKNPPANTGDVGSIPGLGRFPGGENGKPLQYSCLENSMDRGAWQATSMDSQRVRHDWACTHLVMGLPWWFIVKESTCQCWRRRQWHPTPVLLSGKSHGRRSLVGCSPWGPKELDTTERLHFHFSLSCIGEGNGNPLQCSCLENPRDGGAWWAAIYGVAQSQTRLKRLSSSSSSCNSWGHKESDMTEWLNWTELNWRCLIHVLLLHNTSCLSSQVPIRNLHIYSHKDYVLFDGVRHSNLLLSLEHE